MEKIQVKIKPTPEQLHEINKLMHQKDSRIIPKGKTMSPMMEYLVEHFGKEVGEALFKSHDQEPTA